VKHHYVERPLDWPWSTFHRYVAEGHYSPDWGRQCPEHIRDLNWEYPQTVGCVKRAGFKITNQLQSPNHPNPPTIITTPTARVTHHESRTTFKFRFAREEGHFDGGFGICRVAIRMGVEMATIGIASPSS
jgi:hypothetical protein